MEGEGSRVYGVGTDDGVEEGVRCRVQSGG